ncbi:MAG: lysyl endopeptidase, partial [Planctomycetota bacterium]
MRFIQLPQPVQMNIPYSASQGAALAAVLLLAPSALAQQSHGGVPFGLQGAFPDAPPVIEVTPPDVAAYMAEDEAASYRPLRYGAMVDFDISLDDGVWAELADGSRAWRVTITSRGAHSLALEFDTLLLPAGAQMFVYSDENAEFLGAFTHENHHLDGGFVFEPLAGSVMTIEIDVPPETPDPILQTSTVIYDYRDVYGLMDGTVHVGGGAWSGNCLINVNCPQGDPWDVQKRATMRTLSNGALCSGALINNTASDGTQYVLTADHCGQTSNCIFRFGYERPNCSAGTAPTNMQVSGCTVLSTSSTYDNRLLRINNTIPASYDPYFAGWSRGIGTPSYAFSMGHPSGGNKKISIDGNGANRENVFWRVTWSEGTLEGGSSGGPLFDQNGRVRGPACCVNNFTCDQTAYYGRFDRFFSNNPIAQWLDPLGTDQTLLDGYDPNNTCADPANYCTSSPNSFSPGAVMDFAGTASVAANNLELIVSSAAQNQFGIFYYGPSQTQQVFGEGFRCVNGSTVRLPLLSTDVFGGVSYSLNLNSLPGGSQINS